MSNRVIFFLLNKDVIGLKSLLVVATLCISASIFHFVSTRISGIWFCLLHYCFVNYYVLLLIFSADYHLRFIQTYIYIHPITIIGHSIIQNFCPIPYSNIRIMLKLLNSQRSPKLSWTTMDLLTNTCLKLILVSNHSTNLSYL